MKRLLPLLVFVSTSLTSYSQVSLSAGMGMLNGVGTQIKSMGFHLGLEIPRSSDLTLFVRLSGFLPKGDSASAFANMTANNVTTQPSTLTVPYKIKSNTFYIQGGTRSYMLNDYDNGFSLYGGSVMGIGMNKTWAEFSEYDYSGQYKWEGLYSLPNNNPTRGNLIYLDIGIQGGMKYTIPIKGTFYFDVTGAYTVLGVPSNTAAQSSPTYSRLNFLMELGYRRDLY